MVKPRHERRAALVHKINRSHGNVRVFWRRNRKYAEYVDWKGRVVVCEVAH